MQSEPSPRLIRDIEVLRAVAILMTIAGHLPSMWPSSGNELIRKYLTTWWGGVDLFFCISGFVITRSLLADLSGRTDSPAQFVRGAIPFWIRRLFRIQPLAIFWLTLGLVMTLCCNQNGAFGVLAANIADALSAIFQVYNFHAQAAAFYGGGTQGMFGVFWSLSLEEQFYLFLPFLLLLVPRKWAVAAMIGVVALQFPLHRPPTSVFWSVRTDTLLLGVLLALASSTPVYHQLEPVFLRGPWRSLAALAGAFALLILLPIEPPTFSVSIVPFFTGLMALGCAALVFCASFDAGYVFPECWLKSVMIYIGSRSYGLYLAHTLCFDLTNEFLPRFGMDRSARWALAFTAIGLATTLGMTETLYRLVERPLRTYGKRKAVEFRASLSQS